MNNFIICGASRAGKSTLSKRLANEFGVSWLLGDCLVESLEKAFPQTGVQFHGNPYENANIFTDYLIELLKSYQEENLTGFVLDTVHIRPDNVAKICEELGPIPSVFLGYIECDPKEKVSMIRKHDPKQADFWSVKMSDYDLLKHTEGHIQFSKDNKKGCLKSNIPFFDTGFDFENAQEQAYQSLLEQMKAS